MKTNRRSFIKVGSMASAGIFLSKNVISSTFNKPGEYIGDEFSKLSYNLLQQWLDRLVSLQVNNPNTPGLYGGIMCPACARVHGRIGDAIYPLMYMADKSREHKYLDAALNIYNWQEKMVSQPDGSWVNDVNISSWKWTTVFGATALAEALIHHSHLLDNKTISTWNERLEKAAGYLLKVITWGNNINYPVTSSYAFSLIGNYLANDKFINKGREFAHKSLNYFTETNTLLFGEGTSKLKKSPKGCYPIDLGYNVEESLPALTLYALLTNDDEVLDVVIKSLKSHMEFMLPDGAWDNSWGTRNYKWTYWGSRTSDGCQPAYALLSDKVPEFYKVALQNTRLLAQCTNNGYLYGGMHYVSHGVLPCIHHTFTHCKALATVLQNYKAPEVKPMRPAPILPREEEYGVKFFSDIQTWLVSKGKWRATITGYDREYHVKNGHATGGALTILWHDKLGALITASMNKYRLVESANMQMGKNLEDSPLTPRFEYVDEKNRLFQSISDLKSSIKYFENGKEIIFNTSSYLVDENQGHPTNGSIKCDISYVFKNSRLIIKAKCSAPGYKKPMKYFLPVISPGHEKLTVDSDRKLTIHKPDGVVYIKANNKMNIATGEKGRIFNFVPGMEAVPVEFESNDLEIEVYVS